MKAWFLDLAESLLSLGYVWVTLWLIGLIAGDPLPPTQGDIVLIFSVVCLARVARLERVRRRDGE